MSELREAPGRPLDGQTGESGVWDRQETSRAQGVMMTDAEKLAKLDETEQKAWDGTWMKWSTNGRERDIRDRLEIIERCQRIREKLTPPSSMELEVSPHRAG